MKKSNVLLTLYNRDAAMSTLWSVIQQAVVALSTYFIIESIRYTTEGNIQEGVKFICLFTASLVLVYLPNTLSVVYLQRWRLSSIEKFVNIFVQNNFGRTTISHSRNKAKAESWLTNELFTIYDNATNLIYQILSTLMNSVFNILVIAIAIDTRILGFYFAAGVILVFSNYLFRLKISNVSGKVQNSRRELSDAMLSSWQNIFIGNKYNFEKWNTKLERGFANAKKDAASYDLVRSTISSGTVVLALAVIGFGNGLYISENISNISLVAALFMTLPRQLQIIQSIFSLFNLLLSWSGISQQLSSLGTVIEVGQTQECPQKFINYDKIEFHQNGSFCRYSGIDQISKNVLVESSGRCTLRGSNGVGKSTLLSLIKENQGERCFFLPTNYEDLAFDIDFLNQSDGNRLLAVFQKISQLDQVSIIILDEWDANLDQSNTALIDKAIESLSKSKFVIESRHRKN